MDKIRFALAGTFRSNFQGDMRGVLDDSIARLQQLSSELEFDFYPVREGMETIEDARRVSKELEEKDIDFILIQNSSFADGDMLLPFLETSIRLGIWAVPETTESGPLPLNSICATNLYMSEIGVYVPDYKNPVKWFYGFADDKDFILRLTVTIRALTALKNIQASQILMIGDHAPGFHNLVFDEEKVKDMFGIGVQKIELQEFYDEFHTVHSQGQKKSKVKELETQAARVEVSQDHLQKSVSIENTFKALLERYDANGLAIQCWPHIPEELGVMVCSSMGRIMEDFSVSACEGDVMGVISLLALKYLSNSDPMLMDLSAWDKQEDAIYTWHCGNNPDCWYDSNGFSLENHFNRKSSGVVREGRFKSTEITMLRLFDNQESAIVSTGEMFERDKPHYNGSGGWFRNIKMDEEPVDTQDFLNTIFVNNVPHHMAFIDVNRENEVRELIQWLGLQAMEPIGYKPYLQQKS
ncbi:L-fucose isomerase [Fodinibius roseus]|uniref:L-fucose isomerase n=1 Tax=Fodinibius roseus TaxID=1194090 RepID=A0A1M5M3A3_9BACT|nr:hypothetical protein [Fodinibius roseus]SHG71728.1 L-fucose isomerase [Fodinibius roseus]